MGVLKGYTRIKIRKISGQTMTTDKLFKSFLIHSDLNLVTQTVL
jgi:hypothetical protein